MQDQREARAGVHGPPLELVRQLGLPPHEEPGGTPDQTRELLQGDECGPEDAGLITVDPSLKIMILTKENVASQAFAEHIIGLSLPTWIERKFGRLVGFMALQNQTTSCTRLDVPTAHRHDVLSSKQEYRFKYNFINTE